MIDDTYPTSDPTPLLRSLSSNSSNNTETPLNREMEMSQMAGDDCTVQTDNVTTEGMGEVRRDKSSANYSKLEEGMVMTFISI